MATIKIGTDIDLDTCWQEGYLMCEYNHSKLYKGKVLNPNTEVYFFAHVPDYLLKERYGIELDYPRYSDGDKSFTVSQLKNRGIDVILESHSLTANDLWEIYQDNQASIDEIVGLDEEREFPTDVYDMLNLASDINAYCGLS